MRIKISIIVTLFVTVFSGLTKVYAQQTNILDLLPAMIAGATREPDEEPVFPPGVTIIPNQSAGRGFSDNVEIYGEVYNNTNSSIELVEINANVFNGSSLVDTDFTFVGRDIMPPMSRACFVVTTDYNGAFTRVQLESPSFFTTTESLPALSISNVSAQTDFSDNLKIIGLIKNNSAANVEFAQVHATLYNSADRVIGCSLTFSNANPLVPGQESAFDFLTFTPANQVSRYTVQAGGGL